MSAPADAAVASVRFAVRARLDELPAGEKERLARRGRGGADPAVERAVARILADVRERGDAALRELARRHDGVELERLEVPAARCRAALAALATDVRAALDGAAAAIADFHRAALPAPLEVETRPGVLVGRRSEPLGRLGVYAPGGRAAYPSSVLMCVVPAKVAGVHEVVVCSPPGPDGSPSPVTLAACALAGADRVFALGGAGAIAAMAFGTTSVPPVDRLVGPGNAWVSAAKRQLAGLVPIDAPAGPSEVLVVADATAPPVLVAAELLAQAEHDPEAVAVLVSTDPDLPARVAGELERLLRGQPRAATVRAALAAHGALLVAASLDEALDFASAFAPEHLALMVEAPRSALERVRCAGAVFLGAASSVAFGDYVTGANHVLPTGGAARAFSGLSTRDFRRELTWQEVEPGAGGLLAGPTRTLALAEGLPGHALAAELRASPRAAAMAPWEAPRPRRGLDEVELYDPGRAPCAVDLSDNADLRGTPPAVLRLLAGAPAELVSRYPTPYSTALKSALAERIGMSPGHVAVGCGSDELLATAFDAFCEAGARVAYAPPTFGIVPAFARARGALPVPVPLREGLSLDLEGLLAVRAAVVYVCSPNNPTGTLYPSEQVEHLAARARGLILLDEAYAEHAGAGLLATVDASARRAAASRNVIVLRTFSKAWGLAGLRVGYAVGPPPAIAALEKARGPFKVGALAEAAALAVLADDGWAREGVREAAASRERLAVELRARGHRPLPSAANFLFLAVPRAVELAVSLRAAGVAVRPYTGLPVVGEGIRVGIGPWPLMERFLAALDGIAASVRAAAAAAGT